MKLTYKQKIFGYFFCIFALFTIIVIVFEQEEEVKFKESILESRLDSYAEIVHYYIDTNNLTKENTSKEMSRLSTILPNEIRLTIINNDGIVFFDKNISDVHSLENHLDRPEIKKSLFYPFGTNIRTSSSTQQEYLYYAKHYSNYFIRVALPYDIQTKSLLKADNMFIYIALAIFVLILILLNYAASRFGKSISKLRRFTTDIKDDKAIPLDITFPNDELGDIARELFEIFKQKEKNKLAIESEKEKLIQHFQYSGVGLCFFDSNFKKIYANTHFIQYLNFIVNKPTFEVESIFKEEDFAPINNFLSENKKNPFFSFQLEKNRKIFTIQSVVFEDQSFEITIRDISKFEKNRLLKQEMTNNIAHELRTPITSIRGYLETISSNSLPKEKHDQFMEKAYKQSLRLSAIVEDIGMISKMEEASENFHKEKINLSQVIDNVRIDLSDKLSMNEINIHTSIDNQLNIQANYSLVYSIFRNLIDNSITYTGKDSEIYISCYLHDENYVYFSYYDTGKGVSEEHISRLFERFYRVDEGRNRDSGGSGLGLSIVKNAVIFHKGEIQAKNRVGAGLEILFSLAVK